MYLKHLFNKYDLSAHNQSHVTILLCSLINHLTVYSQCFKLVKTKSISGFYPKLWIFENNENIKAETKCLHNRPDSYILNDRHYVCERHHTCAEVSSKPNTQDGDQTCKKSNALTLENLVSIVLFRMVIHKALTLS